MHRHALPPLLLLAVSLSTFSVLQAEDKADESVFSGPQVGEQLPGFKIHGVLGAKDQDLIAKADGKPICLIFVHGVTRPSIGLIRAVMSYAAPLSKKHGLVNGLVFLSEDATAMEARVKRMSHALPKNVDIGISPDGQEGPGAYGLNRKVTLTVLVGKEGKTSANFAIVDPSLAADLKGIATAIAKAVDVDPPSKEQLLALTPRRRPNNQKRTDQKQDPMVRTLIRPVINKQATDEEVDKAAEKLASYLEKNAAARREVGQIARRIVESGRLGTYGTPQAQKHIRKWAEKYAKPQEKAKGRSRREGKGKADSQP